MTQPEHVHPNERNTAMTTITERLALWGVTIELGEDGWYLDGTDDGYGNQQAIEEVIDTDEYGELKCLNRELKCLPRYRITSVINNHADPTWIRLDERQLETHFDMAWRDHGRISGPEFDVKLHNVWSELQRLEDKLGIEIPDDIDSSGWIWSDTVAHEREYIMNWIGELFPNLDVSKFVQYGRQGGQMYYNCGDSLSLAEADELRTLAEEYLASWVEGIGSQIAMECARATLEQLAERTVNEHRTRFMVDMRVAAAKNDLPQVRACLDSLDYLDDPYLVSDWALDEAEMAL